MRGKLKSGHVEESKVRQQHEAIREKNKLAFLHEFKRAKVQTETMNNDLEFLNKVEGKFDPFQSVITGQTVEKKQLK